MIIFLKRKRKKTDFNESEKGKFRRKKELVFFDMIKDLQELYYGDVIQPILLDHEDGEKVSTIDGQIYMFRFIFYIF